MSIDIWNTCHGTKQFILISETAWRLVEAQEKISLRKLVDSFEEQSILEKMINASQSSNMHNYLNLHEFLYTPFKYPPLKHGSRFGNKTESSLWYGSLQ